LTRDRSASGGAADRRRHRTRASASAGRSWAALGPGHRSPPGRPFQVDRASSGRFVVQVAAAAGPHGAPAGRINSGHPVRQYGGDGNGLAVAVASDYVRWIPLGCSAAPGDPVDPM